MITPNVMVDVYFDGACPLCRWSKEHIEPYDKKHRLRWMDFRDPEILASAAPFTFDQLNKEMHVHLPNGDWTKGFDGWAEVLKVIPTWRWLGRLMKHQPLSGLGPTLYKWVAARRFSLFGVPPPCSPDGVCSLHEHRSN
jgi:predicted DCC family thiol-disulfide oxidoreductase YuxK